MWLATFPTSPVGSQTGPTPYQNHLLAAAGGAVADPAVLVPAPVPGVPVLVQEEGANNAPPPIRATL